MEEQSIVRYIAPGTAGAEMNVLHTFPTYDHGAYYELVGTVYDTKIFGDNLYFSYKRGVHPETGVTPGWYIGKLLNATTGSGTLELEYINTGLPVYYGVEYGEPYYSWGYGLLTISETDFYVGLIGSDGKYTVFNVSYADSVWTTTAKTTPLSTTYYGLNMLQQDPTTGYFIVGALKSSTDNPVVRCYDSNWALLTTYTIPNASGGIHSPSWLSTFSTDMMLIGLCGKLSNDVWMVYPDGYWEIKADDITDADTEPTMGGTIADIVSNYTDLGTPSEKRVARAYLPLESRYATCGAFTLEPGYSVNVTVHEVGETTEPTAATSLRPFAHAGCQTWKYTNNQFSSITEQWQDIRLDVGANGKMFRYSIRMGDIPGANPGRLKIKPPYVMAQIKNEQ
jgi:hypothetical protein